MNVPRHGQIKEIFLRACQLQGEARLHYLEAACADDAELRFEVESLLEFHLPETILGGAADTTRDSSQSIEEEDQTAWIGRRLGKYEIHRVIGSGGMGVVLEAFDATIERRVAIKVLHPELSRDEPMRMRFLLEARAAGNLNHPNIITIYDVASQQGVDYLVMEYVDGKSAAEHLKLIGPYATKDASEIMAQACRGLSAAHAQGMVHRDVKPANLLITKDGTVRVTDFGVAKIEQGNSLHLTREGQLIGTPYFMSPEQCEGNLVDARSDIYSLGATYYSLLVGRMPYEDQKSLAGVIHAHCHAPPPDPRAVDPSLSTGCCEIVRRAMAKQPEDRYQSAEEMLAALDIEIDLIGVGEEMSISPSTERSRRTALKIVVALCLAFVLLLSSLVGSRLFDALGFRNAGNGGMDGGTALNQQEPIRIGLLQSLSGTMAVSEAVMIDGYQLAIDELNEQGGVLGRPIEAIIRDGASQDVVFARRAQELIEEEQVCTIFGCFTSSSRKAVKAVVEQENHLLVYSANGEGLELSPNIIYLGADASQTAVPCVRWAYAFAKKRTFFLVGSDYVFPHVVNEIVKDDLEEMGGRILGEAYLPLGSTSVGDVVQQIKAANPDAILNTISGDTQVAFLRRLRAEEVTATLLATGIEEQVVQALDQEALAGDYSIGTYFQSLARPANQDFVARFRKRFGMRRVVDCSIETAYDAILLWAKGVAAAGRIEPLTIRDAMLRQEIDAPSGKLRLDPDTHYAFRTPMIGQIQEDGQFRIILQSERPLAPEPFPDSRTREQWEELLGRLYERWGGNWSAPVNTKK